MSSLIDFSDVKQRLSDFENETFEIRYKNTPLLRALAYILIAFEWEGTPEILSDAFVVESSDILSFEATLTKLGYQCRTTQYKVNSIDESVTSRLPCFIESEQFSGLLLSLSEGQGVAFDYVNNNIININLNAEPFRLTYITQYSRFFREPPPETSDKSNWIKYTFYRFNDEIKSLLLFSFISNLLGALQPFYIMAVYTYALNSGSLKTLYWLTFLALVLAFSDFAVKSLRMKVLNTSGQDLAIHISKNVISKLLWLPYSMTSSADISAQLARLNDINQFRKLVTAEATLSYFDLPFVIIFIIAITFLSGYAALVVLVGILLMIVFCLYARYIYTQAIAKSSRANAMISYQWNQLLRSIATIQNLPLMPVLKSRFKASHQQSSDEADHVEKVNSRIQAIGNTIIQIIGTTAIITAVYTTMEGISDAGAMIATVILVWKALSPIMGIYNSLIKFNAIKKSANQINALMSLNDDKVSLEKSPPIRKFSGEVSLNNISHRYPSATSGLTNLNLTIPAGTKVAISGPAGCGKTTLLMILAALEHRYQGFILVDGYNLKQFNNYRYRRSINYIPFNLHLYDGSIYSNFVIHNGMISEAEINHTMRLLGLDEDFPDGLHQQLDKQTILDLPSATLQKLRLAIGLGNMNEELILIDEPLVGSELENKKYLDQLFSGPLKQHTVVFTTVSPHLLATSSHCLLLEQNGSQKYFGSPDKVLNKSR
ncbi:ATP-binding cassette domain-containing protein [Paraferrimonas sp. SM1919]|uniref:ATP-binding cassette domain-containing protein n=1 Tax=Paraferrimonas sp. SM1919 TaxID=2662263 RepID=UPI0013D3DDD8|nr:ATP-binding cassette domain-containing protein [Paraferrimonas sp. SM1919]